MKSKKLTWIVGILFYALLIGYVLVFFMSCSKDTTEVPVIVPDNFSEESLPYCFEFGKCDIYDDKTFFPEKNGIIRIRIWLTCCSCLSYYNITYSDLPIVEEYVIPAAIEELEKYYPGEAFVIVYEAQTELKTDCK